MSTNVTERVKIRLKTFEDQSEFIRRVSRLDADINIYDGSIAYDAKSLMAVFSLALGVVRDVEIITDDEAETEKFMVMCKDFA